MNFLLANPAWLWLLSLVVLPVLVHLFARSNPPKYAFSDTAFLRRIMKKTARMRKPQDWLLLLLRTLAVLALLFVFLQPLLTSDKPTVGGSKTTVYLVDRSASMACKDGASSRFASACGKVGELLAAGDVDQANVVWIDAEPDALFPQPGPNLDFIGESLKRTEVNQEAGAISAALKLAINQLEQVQGERELVVLSDFQSSAWKEFALKVPKDIEVVKIKVGEQDVENVAVHELFAKPSDPVVGQDVLMVCRLRNYSATPRRTSLYLESDGGRQSREVEIPAWGEAEVQFKTHFTQPGLVPLAASIAEDVFPADDRRHALVRVRETLKLASVVPSEGGLHVKAPAVLRKLADAFEWLEYQEVAAGSLPAAGTVDYLFLHDWDGGQVDALRVLADAGTTLLIQPSTGVSLAQCHQLLGLVAGGSEEAIPVDNKSSRKPGATGSVSIQPSPLGAGWKAGIARGAGEREPVFALFRSGEFGNPAEGVFLRRLRLAEKWPAGVMSWIDYQDGVPGLLVSATNGGAPVVLWNLPLSTDLSTWSGQSPFVPFMGELLLHCRPQNVVRGLEVMPGSLLSWSPGDEVSADSVVLSRASGESLAIQVDMTAQGLRMTSQESATPGLYHWKLGDSVASLQVVNFPVTESDLRSLDPSSVQGGDVVDTGALLRRAALGDGIPLWPWLLGLALLFLLLEQWVCLWKPKSENQNPAGR
ncbi:VWA domain-containing protein [Verrucomicrobiaceae bacterium N1E253]|uniref:VWA domain-containing protein n=1 Tax=Oceaniferula marina TaxID=2748318 RepID=A0A851GDE0_9BACT|nr:VWA domain-containing protein [Oceaniferula marina]NWK55573.1 VWA domain-containing protein [Oceaniferula marina]